MKKVVCIVLCAVMLLTGCGGIQLTAKESDIIAEYAATALLRNNPYYSSRLLDEVEELEPETETTLPIKNNTSDGTGYQQDEIQPEIKEQPAKSLAEAMNISGVEVTYQGYEVLEKYEYPAGEGISYAMDATTDKVLLILKFQIKNNSAEPIMCDLLSNKLVFRCTVNNEKRVSSQLTMLLNDLYSYQETVNAGETKDTILIFQIPKEYQGNITSLDLMVKYKEESTTFPLEQ